MNRKLTLLLDETVIHQAKSYAERHKITLSGMVEKYFRYVSSEHTDKREIRRLPREVEELIGIISIPEDLDVKNEYRRHRADKTLHD